MPFPDIVLHWYPASPFARKVVWALNYKKIPFKTVEILPFEPRPLRRPLDGGYRRSPILQINNQVYCDTPRILDEIERRYPEPSLYPSSSSGHSTRPLCKSIGQTIDPSIYLIGTQRDPKTVPMVFINDRAIFGNGRRLDDPSTPLLRSDMIAHLNLAEQLIRSSDGKWVLDTLSLSAADLHLSMIAWYADVVLGREAFQELCPKLLGLLDRVTATIQEADVHKVSPEEALQIARKDDIQAEVLQQTSTVEKLAIGTVVEVTPNDVGREPAIGKLMSLTPEEVVIEHANPGAGSKVFIHFPAMNFVITPSTKQE